MPATTTAKATKLDPALIWNGWTQNYIAREDGFIIHAFLERKFKTPTPTRALCGVLIADSGLLNLRDKEFEPGCFRCRRILQIAGLDYWNDHNSEKSRQR